MIAATLAIRADGGAGTGAGHVMRCLALADAWRRAGGSVEWFCTQMPRLLRDVLATRGITRHDLASADDWDVVGAWARQHSGAWVVVDGYGFERGPAILRAAGARVIVIDDIGAWSRYDCDVLVNQNPDAGAIPYRTGAAARLLGPAYALLRDEFLLAGPSSRTFTHPAQRVLVSFGGHDAHGQAARVVRLLRSTACAASVDVVSGLVATEIQAAGHGGSVGYHQTTNLAPLMRAADAAIVAAGSVCWELAYLGVPALALVVAANQEALAGSLDAAGVIRNAGWHDRTDDADLAEVMTAFLGDSDRDQMSRRGRALVDGAGASRVLDAMLAVERSSARGGAIA
jgi:UDP-2,4-diacetamido-2,4,6-trideoxy-beta-L-altropyranose hydrolase